MDRFQNKKYFTCEICGKSKKVIGEFAHNTGTVYMDSGRDESYVAKLSCSHYQSVNRYSQGYNKPQHTESNTLTPEYCKTWGIEF